MRRFPILLSALLSCMSTPQVHAEDEILWPLTPIRIDRAKQTYERLPPLLGNVDRRISLSVPLRVDVLDSSRFSFDGKTFRIDHIHPVDLKRMCRNPDGSRWTCGRWATTFLGSLVRGKELRCDMTHSGKEILLSRCQSGTKDVAAEIILNGFGLTDADGPFASTLELARTKKAGLWKNADCITDFDHC